MTLPKAVARIGRSRLLRNITVYTSGTLAAFLISIVKGFFVARMMGPTVFGVWGILTLVLQYGTWTHVGAKNALNREVPRARGAGTLLEARRIEEVSFGVVLLTAVLASAGVAAYAVVLSPDTPAGLRDGLLLVAVLLLLQQIEAFIISVLIANNGFHASSVLQIGLSITDAIVSLALLWRFGLSGFLVGRIAALATTVAVAVGVLHVRPGIRIDVPAARKLLRIGLPMWAVGVADYVSRSSDSLVVTALLGIHALGQYSFGQMLVSAIRTVTTAGGDVIYRRQSEVFGKSGTDASLRSLVLAPSFALSYGMPLLVGPAILVWPVFVRLFFPEYEPGVSATQVLLLSAGVVGVASGGFLNATGREVWSLIINLVAFAGKLVMIWLALTVSPVLASVAWGALAYRLVSSALIGGYTLRMIETGAVNQLRLTGALYVPFMAMCVLLYFPYRHPALVLPGTLLQILLFVLLWVPVAVFGLRVARGTLAHGPKVAP